jgi:monovalent cation:H+ antiporter, CPA1 family
MEGLPQVLLIVAGLLVVTGLLQPLASRLNLSHTVLLAVIGVCIGVGAGMILRAEPDDMFGHAAALILDFPITSSGFIYIFLPILLFEAALMIDVRRMMEDAAPIFLLAVIAVLVTAAVVGLVLWPAADVPLVACLLLGAIIATTDPAAVVAIFRDLGAPGRLTRLVEGESLLNDATAIAAFTVLLDILLRDHPVAIGDAVEVFLTSFVGGAALGLIAGRIMMSIVPMLGDSRLAEMTLTLALPYIVFVLCEHIDVSGVTAVVAAGLMVSALGRNRFAPENRAFLHDVWAQIAFWAGSLVFVLASMLVPRLLIGATPYDFFLILLVAFAALAARALVLFGMLPFLSMTRLAQEVSHAFKFVIVWGGLRGAVTLALALAVTENRALDPDIQEFVAILATGFVLFTLLINGTTLRPVIRLLKLDQLSPIDQALRSQVLTLSLSDVRDAVNETAAEYHIGRDTTEAALTPYQERIGEPVDGDSFELEISDRDRITLGLVALTNRERELILGHFRQRSVSRRTLEALLAHVEQLLDAARTGGRIDYNRTVRRHLAFGWHFRLAHALHRFVGFEAPLANRLADRFELLLVVRMVLEEMDRFRIRKMTRTLGHRVTELLGDILAQRTEATGKALEALRLQYPAYAEALQRRFLLRSALRLEEAEYQTLFEEGLIGPELYNDLRSEVLLRQQRASARPRLDLGLNTRELVSQLPLFATLSAAQIEKVCAMLRPRFAVPGERLIRRGERGDVMYFISSGAVEVSIGKQKIGLGRGDFIGELALLGNRRRQADVTALGYCQLLVLREEDFRKLLATDPAIRAQIDKVAADRRQMNEMESAAS